MNTQTDISTIREALESAQLAAESGEYDDAVSALGRLSASHAELVAALENVLYPPRKQSRLGKTATDINAREALARAKGSQ